MGKYAVAADENVVAALERAALMRRPFSGGPGPREPACGAGTLGRCWLTEAPRGQRRGRGKGTLHLRVPSVAVNRAAVARPAQDLYNLAYVHGPGGILVMVAEELTSAGDRLKMRGVREMRA